MLTPITLKKVFPNCAYPEKWSRPLNETMRQFEINTPARVTAFLGQIAVESQELNKLEENLSYAPGRLTAVWPHRFPDAEKARPYSRNPEKLANAVYANRLGNGDEASRDGYRFRGRGLVQVTGRDNYVKVGEALKIDLINMPDALLEPKFAALSAGVFWSLNKLNTYADDGDFGDITYKVTGARDTVELRNAYRKHAQEELFGASDVHTSHPSNADGQPDNSTTPESQGSWFD